MIQHEEKLARICVICGVNIDGRDAQCVTCGQTCRRKMRYVRRRVLRKHVQAGNCRHCQHCEAPIVGRSTQAKFCRHECLQASTKERARAARLVAKASRNCKWCGGCIDVLMYGSARYCCQDCRYHAGKKRDREKVALYRANDPARYQAHRRKQNEQRALATAALRLIREIETDGLEALL